MRQIGTIITRLHFTNFLGNKIKWFQKANSLYKSQKIMMIERVNIIVSCDLQREASYIDVILNYIIVFQVDTDRIFNNIKHM